MGNSAVLMPAEADRHACGGMGKYRWLRRIFPLFMPPYGEEVITEGLTKNLYVIHLPFTAETAQKLPEMTVRKVLTQAGKLLSKWQVQTLYMESALQKATGVVPFFEQRGFAVCKGRKVWEFLGEELVRKQVKTYADGDGAFHVGIAEEQLDGRVLPIIQTAAAYVKNITVFTSDLADAQRLFDMVYGDTGLSLCYSNVPAYDRCGLVYFLSPPPEELVWRDGYVCLLPEYTEFHITPAALPRGLQGALGRTVTPAGMEFAADLLGGDAWQEEGFWDFYEKLESKFVYNMNGAVQNTKETEGKNS